MLGLFKKIASRLQKSAGQIKDGLGELFSTRRTIDEETLAELEDILIMADLGPRVAMEMTDCLRQEKFKQDMSEQDVRLFLANQVVAKLKNIEAPLNIKPERPHVILMVGVNGAGKTTTIGKLAAKYKAQGLKVILAAGDTFRAAAVEQLQIWGQRTDCLVVAKELGHDPAALAYDAYAQAQKEQADILIIDTAGRLQNKQNLMNELAKVIRVLKKQNPDAPHDILMTIDATTGQNAIQQVKVFSQYTQITGLILTKLDGTAKGGIIIALQQQFNIPVHYIGLGEGVEDLIEFQAEAYAYGLLSVEPTDDSELSGSSDG